MPREIQLALVANDAFYTQMLGERYDSTYSQSSDEFKAATTRNDLVALLKTVRQKASTCGPPTLRLTSYHLSGGMVDLTYGRQCANSGEVSEKFSWKIVNDRALLNGYSVDGPGLAQGKSR
jgi:hypothetical protein